MELSRSFLKALLFITLSLANPVTLLCILFYNLDSYDESLIHYLYVFLGRTLDPESHIGSRRGNLITRNGRLTGKKGARKQPIY